MKVLLIWAVWPLNKEKIMKTTPKKPTLLQATIAKRNAKMPSENNSGYRVIQKLAKEMLLIVEPGAIIKLPHEDQNKTIASLRKTKHLTIDQKDKCLGLVSRIKHELLESQAQK